MSKNENSTTLESKYIQQHLANERTYLAWIRTAIAIIGVGFLVTNLHHSLNVPLTGAEDFLATLIGLTSVGIGIITVIIATVVYLDKIKSINTQTFTSSKHFIITLSFIIIFIAVLFSIYFLLI
jgi:putative membrane protein